MKLKNFHTVLENTPLEIRREVNKEMDILDRINYLLKIKFNGKQKLLAEALGKSESEVSRWFSGYQNYTQRTISKLEIAFGAPITGVIWEDESPEENLIFTMVKAPIGQDTVTISVNDSGALITEYCEVNL